MKKSLSAVFEMPYNWTQETWLMHLNALLAFLTAETMDETQARTNQGTSDTISMIEAFILALMSFDEKIANQDILKDRRAHFLNAVKGMANYAKVIQMEHIQVIRIPKQTH